MGGDRRSDGLLFFALFSLTVVTGMVDGASFLGLGHVFTANQTGNVLLLGFSFAGSQATHGAGLSSAITVIALAGFVAGAASGGLLTGPAGRTPRLAAGLVAEILGVGAALGVAVGVGTGGTAGRDTAVAVLAWAMGIQNATVRRLGRRDVSTTVLTTSLGGLVADAVEVGGRPVRMGRRVATVALLFAGAAAGGGLERLSVGWALTGALVLAAVGATALLAARRLTPRG